jgi:hypothetical protein
MSRTTCRFPRLTLAVLLAVWVKSNSLLAAAETTSKESPGGIDYLEPPVLTGTIYAKAPDPKEVLFTFRRTATRSGPTVRVLREYTRPNGALAARERLVYEAGRLVSCHLEELQSGGSGSVVVQPDRTDSKERRIAFEYTQDHKQKIGTEKLEEDTLVNDMVGPFIATHWNDLMSRLTVKFRFAVITRAETIGFKLSKKSETTWRGKPAVLLKMEPTSWIIAQWVDPLFFTVETEGQHRVLQYLGRTTPGIRKGNGWEDLDALTIFGWK